MLHIVRWVLLLGFGIWGAYMVMWSYESASFSVPAEGPVKAVYEARAMLGFPLGIALISIGALFFLGLRSTKH
ncbi:hypothetical protein FRZ61_27670 [Hypericibacter adhaerens]|uniref:Uncharacterized protein n=1 Tax=Hypericibacter adhaerens TaxID=2602016 RepID=A0A5J6N0Q8_9PROT|nr:hypothetical protein FRZ61_27670 [Hypericibacter adhaerens]